MEWQRERSDHERSHDNPARPDDERRTPRFLTVRQLADYLQVNEKKVYSLVREGALPATKLTGKWLFPRDIVYQSCCALLSQSFQARE